MAAANPIPGVTITEADACEIASLEAVGLDGAQVVVAATGDDKANLVVSLLAKTEFGVPRVVARVNHPKNEWLFDSSWGVDVAVSTPRMLSALVEEAVTVGDLVRLFTFREGGADLVEITLANDSPVVGGRVGDVVWPTETALVECRLETGRTHQIRVHLSDHGLPLLGDSLYGGSVSDAFLRRAGETLGLNEC